MVMSCEDRISYGSVADAVKEKESRVGHDFRLSRFCQEENGNSEKNHTQNDERRHSARPIDDRISQEESGRQNKNRRHYRITRNPEWGLIVGPAAKDENRRNGQGIKGHNRSDKGVGELLEGAE